VSRQSDSGLKVEAGEKKVCEPTGNATEERFEKEVQERWSRRVEQAGVANKVQARCSVEAAEQGRIQIGTSQ
jgi:hypothetical protein